jgi:hypothetical protein
MSSLSSMPDEVLRAILRHVPLKDRIKSCFLVSRRLLAAAATATEQFALDFSHMSTQHTESALRWLSHYGQHVTQLEVSMLQQQLLQLPCQNLLELKLHGLEVQLGTAGGQPGVLQTCTKLTHLELSCRTLDVPVDGLVDVGLSRLVYLQHLKVGFDAHGLSSATLPCLQHLTHLDIILNSFSKENLMQLSGLTNLQELGYTADYWGTSLAVGPSSVPGLTLPGSLKKLWLSAPVEASILSVVPAGLQALSIDSPMEGPSEGPGLLLSCMARLQHLTGLNLTPMSSSLRWPPAGPAYSALTASSNLVDLSLAESSFPLGVWPYVFAGVHRLPHLTALNVQEADDSDVSADSNPWTAADLSSLVSCCPSLCSVHRLFAQPGLHVSELHKLTALTYIAIDFAANATSAADEYVSGLAAVTQLQHLELIAQSPNVTPASLTTLTSLTALTHLSLDFRYGHWLFHCAQVSRKVHFMRRPQYADVALSSPLASRSCHDPGGGGLYVQVAE